MKRSLVHLTALVVALPLCALLVAGCSGPQGEGEGKDTEAQAADGDGQGGGDEKAANGGKEAADGGGEQETDGDGAAKKEGEGETKVAGSAGEVSVMIRDYEGLEQLIAEKKGKVVVMDCWSTSCTPCMQEFHNLVEIHNEYGPEKVACISVSLDYIGLGKPEDLLPPVKKFLTAQKATFDNVLAGDEDTVMYEKLEIPAIPAVLVYDQQGEVAKKFTGGEGGGEGVSYEQVKELVAELVKGDAAGAQETGD